MPQTDYPLAPVANVDINWPLLHPKNPRHGDINGIVEMIKASGWWGCIVVQKSSRWTLVGNHRLQAARRLGMTEVPAMIVDVDDERALRILLADNRASDQATNDDAVLAEILGALSSSVEAFDGTGFSQIDYAELVAGLHENKTGQDTTPKPRAEAVSVLGERYELGDHVVVCGDSTDPAVVAACVGSDTVDMVWEDPPYGVSYEGTRKQQLEGGARVAIANDALKPDELTAFLQRAFAELTAFLQRAFAAQFTHLKKGGAVYVAAPAGPLFVSFGLALGDVWRQTLVWKKDRFVLGMSDYHYAHEAVFYGWKPGASHYFVDDRTQDTVQAFARPSSSEDHPTMKPVELIEKHIANSSRRGEIVFDGFGGSGSTLIAAAKQGRRARLVELDPVYVDVIRRRWTTYAQTAGISMGSGSLAT